MSRRFPRPAEGDGKIIFKKVEKKCKFITVIKEDKVLVGKFLTKINSNYSSCLYFTI